MTFKKRLSCCYLTLILTLLITAPLLAQSPPAAKVVTSPVLAGSVQNRAVLIGRLSRGERARLLRRFREEWILLRFVVEKP